MPTSVATPRPAVRTTPAPTPAARCGACPHPVADHDAIGLRYCRATVTSALDRGCVCGVG
ncbi:RGCVC family protein [Candidatus Blastococcus massiliensis]|uniref:RGCVC family protein n=1 Tax=Candidatus Blastococcus massiliensis TaxID=1470358 RepID=UPI0004BB06D6|nr:RGCVC family protein [Candidatus Blastococcus massiliensis]